MVLETMNFKTDSLLKPLCAASYAGTSSEISNTARAAWPRCNSSDFERAFGDDARGKGDRQDQGAEGRFRYFTREEIAQRSDNLDIAWLRDDEDAAENELTEPEDIAAAILGHLRAALAEIEGVTEEPSLSDVESQEASVQ